MLSHIAWVMLWPIMRIIYRFEGIHNIPKSGAVILVANHIGDLDPWRIGPFVPRTVHWLAKEELFNPWKTFQDYWKKFSLLTPIVALIVPLVVWGSCTNSAHPEYGEMCFRIRLN